ncbi:hypothetical protein HYDPIDRAFT_116975 [Hydnomerulius pinastri MD-312]|uniref:Unplaced genomic scaffold scaffold_36, whole genome shotgun sequence n=1 Tax=Hydnomerulius pinastri MD-312 TaxID=994086 RepID=A0A0C9VS72_9AGAM|nr:hypothetical protein HYDPIDRAFT_116975 [Hydnomerulius pinastri MD-312]
MGASLHPPSFLVVIIPLPSVLAEKNREGCRRHDYYFVRDDDASSINFKHFIHLIHPVSPHSWILPPFPSSFIHFILGRGLIV